MTHMKNGEEFLITPQTLMDYGCLTKVIVRGSEQDEEFSSAQLRMAINKEFELCGPIVELEISTAPPEWNELEIIPSIHRIWVSSTTTMKLEPSTNTEPHMLCRHQQHYQLRHRRIMTLAFKHNKIDRRRDNYRLFSKNKNQKIYIKHGYLS